MDTIFLKSCVIPSYMRSTFTDSRDNDTEMSTEATCSYSVNMPPTLPVSNSYTSLYSKLEWCLQIHTQTSPASFRIPALVNAVFLGASKTVCCCFCPYNLHHHDDNNNNNNYYLHPTPLMPLPLLSLLIFSSFFSLSQHQEAIPYSSFPFSHLYHVSFLPPIFL